MLVRESRKPGDEMGSIENRLISAARSAWYAAYEPARLYSERLEYDIASQWNVGDPLVSVLIPTYCRPKLLVERALASVAAQTYKNIEIVIGNHGADSATAAKPRRNANSRLTARSIFSLPQHYCPPKYLLDLKENPHSHVKDFGEGNAGYSLQTAVLVFVKVDHEIIFAYKKNHVKHYFH